MFVQCVIEMCDEYSNSVLLLGALPNKRHHIKTSDAVKRKAVIFICDRYDSAFFRMVAHHNLSIENQADAIGLRPQAKDC